MPYTPPTTRATDFLVTAAAWNADIVENIKFLHRRPSVRAHNAAAFNLAVSGTNYTMPLDSERWDWAETAMHDPAVSNSRLTAPVAGVYGIYGYLAFAAHATGMRQIWVAQNGTTIPGSIVRVPAGAESVLISTYVEWSMTAGQYVELLGRQTSGAALTATPEFGMTWLGSL